MIHFCIVDDDDIYSFRLMDYLTKIEEENPEGEKFQVTRFKDGSELVNGYNPVYDIILMDIEMEKMDGMTAAEFIRKKDRDVVIIFITNLSQYAIRGYRVDALDYVLKPVSFYAFSETIKRAIDRMVKRQDKVLTVPLGKGSVEKVNISSINYIEVFGHTIIYHLTDRKLEASGTIKELEEKLDPHQFFRCNKGYLVNLDKVQNINGTFATVGGDNIQVSRAKKKLFIDALNDYISERAK